MVRLVEEAITFYSILVLVLLTTTSAEATTGLGEEEDYDGRGHVNGLLEQPSSDNDGALLLRYYFYYHSRSFFMIWSEYLSRVVYWPQRIFYLLFFFGDRGMTPLLVFTMCFLGKVLYSYIP